MRTIFTLIILSLVFSGCASSRGFNRGKMFKQPGQEAVVTDSDIKKAFEKKPQLPHPYRLGIYFQDHAWRWHWVEEDRQRILKMCGEFKEKGIISDVFVISPVTASGDKLPAIRLAAAQHGADALLIVRGVSEKDRYNNAWGWTYIGIITALLVPGTKVDVLFMTSAVMWDVRNQYLYLTVDAESTMSQTRPAWLVDEEGLMKAAKHDSFSKLLEKLSESVITAGIKGIK